MRVAWTSRFRKLALWLGGAVVLYAVLGFLVAPPIVRHQLEKQLSGLLGRQVTVDSVRINPFALSASVRNLTIKAPGGAADAVGFEELSVNVTWSSLVRGGVVVESVRLAKPYVRAVRGADGKYDFQDVLDRFAATPAEPAPKGSTRFSVYNIQVSDGRIDFDDRPAKTKHSVTEIHIGLPFVSSLPQEVDILVQPRLSAKVNGSPFEVAGETKPFKDTREATLRIDLDQLELAKYLQYSPLPLRIRVPFGKLTTRLVFTSVAGRGGQLQTLSLAGTASLQKVRVQTANGEPLVALARLSVELESLDFLKRRAAIKAVRLEAPEVDIARLKDGSLNLQAVLPAAPEQAAKPAAKSSEPPFDLAIANLAVLAGQVRFVDNTTAKPVRVSLNDVSMAVAGLSSAPDTRADLKLTGRLNRIAPVEVAGKINVLSKELFVDLTATERDIDLLPMSPYSGMYAGYAIAKGRLSLKHVVKLEGRTLGTQNSIRLEQFTFGEKVDSPTATQLPVAMAVAVLKDRNGIIAVDLPVSASLDDPQAGRGEILRREAGGFIGKAATQPFALLGGEELAYLEFAPGSAAIDAGGEAKLRTLAKALYERPGLKVEAGGRIDPEADVAALKQAAAAKAAAKAKDEGSKAPAETAVTGEDLRQLAQARAQVARDWLVASGKLPAERVSIAVPAAGAEALKDKRKPTRVDFVLR